MKKLDDVDKSFSRKTPPKKGTKKSSINLIEKPNSLKYSFVVISSSLIISLLSNWDKKNFKKRILNLSLKLANGEKNVL